MHKIDYSAVPFLHGQGQITESVPEIIYFLRELKQKMEIMPSKDKDLCFLNIHVPPLLILFFVTMKSSLMPLAYSNFTKFCLYDSLD